ncbi:DUF1108 family protein [Mammaliicoccus sciuri]|uniref:DUF1108 family protein n=1 Tax=Mammaliicoccus sciuri TaxID=1296 RepID=UPI000733CBD2|nr:DUF1108 family protein [Mammaliicoccus sciuri]KTT79820.1 hypothetical protein NS202_11820 [Mammaliicoccus sciuri]MCJ1783128.1 DUF1108 family protein [Mammaliicoccus sciuri]
MLEVGTAGKTTFPYHGFQFMSKVTLLPSGISLDIKCIETDQMIIRTFFYDQSDYECQRDIIENAIRDYVLANTTEVERLFKFLCSNNWTRDLFD